MSGIHFRGADGIIGIIGATGLEIGLLKKRMELLEKGKAGRGYFFRGHLSGKELVLVESGIGYTRAKEACIQMMERFSPMAIFSFGLAGSVDMNTRIGDILLATHFLWVKDMETLEVQNTYKLDEELVYNISIILDKCDIIFKIGRLLTVPLFVFKVRERCRIGRETGVEAVDMEGAAIAAEARKHRIPVMALRLISDDMSTREINYGMVIGRKGKPTLKGGVRFSLVHGRNFMEVLRFGREVRRLGARLSGIGARIVEEVAPLSMRGMDLHAIKKKIPCTRFRSKRRGELAN